MLLLAMDKKLPQFSKTNKQKGGGGGTKLLFSMTENFRKKCYLQAWLDPGLKQYDQNSIIFQLLAWFPLAMAAF